MDLLVSEAQQPIVDSFSAFLDREFSLDRFHRQPSGGDVSDHKRWQAMAELGWFGLGLPEDWFGVGCDLTDEMLLFRELGRHLVSPSTLAAVLAARIGAACGDRGLVEAIVGGRERPALAVPLATASLDNGVTGDFHIIDGDGCNLLLTWTPEWAVLIERGAAAQSGRVSCLDDAVVLERVTFEGAMPRHVVTGEQEPIHLRATVLLSALLTGAAESVRDMAVEYAKIREQFGRPIGAFQAIKHRCADMAVRAEAALAQTRYATVMARDGAGDSQEQASAALLLAGRAALNNATANIQVHGAMGYTAECHAHRFLKRARLLGAVGGSARQHQRQLLTVAPKAAEGAR